MRPYWYCYSFGTRVWLLAGWVGVGVCARFLILQQCRRGCPLDVSTATQSSPTQATLHLPISPHATQSKRSKGIAEWGVTQASLEEAFVKVVTSFEDGVQAQTQPPELSGGSRPERGRALE